MDIAQYISQFFYRIRYWLLWGTLLVTILVIYITQFLPFSYTVEGSMYAGVSTSVSLNGTTASGSVVVSTFDNLINIAQSRGTHKKVSLRLLANAYTFGEEWHDNRYIQAKHYRQLLQQTPKEILNLVDRKDVNKTLANLTAYQQSDLENTDNFLYTIFNERGPFYSANALAGIKAERVGSSDILTISYTSADPGITQQTVEIVIEELKDAYEILRFKSARDVIAYFEEQVRLAQERLRVEEDKLMQYCIEKRVINYPEQSEALAILRYAVDDRLETAMRTYASAVALRKMLDEKMDVRAEIIRNNTNLLRELDRISTLNQSITEREIFVTDTMDVYSNQIKKDRLELKRAEENISNIADNLNEFNFSKEGVGINDMVLEWLRALVDEAKSEAELKVLQDRRRDVFRQFTDMSPVGTMVARMERSIGVAEDNYRNQIGGLADAYLQLKNLEMNTSNLQLISPPEYPLTDNGRQRLLYVLLAFFGSLFFITFYFLLIELLDRTLRDPFRSKRLTGLPVIAAFNGVSNLKYRGFLKACNRRAAAYCCRRLNQYIVPGRPTIINLLSMEHGEGKSYLTRYFTNYWAEEGMTVRVVEAGLDFLYEDNKDYVNAQRLTDFWQLNEAEETPNILLVEYPPLQDATVPLAVLKQGDVNLLVANACRLWRVSDDTMLQPIKDAMGEVPLFLYLNNADREVVETFTGELPPRTYVHNYFSRLFQLGLTSKKAAVR